METASMEQPKGLGLLLLGVLAFVALRGKSGGDKASLQGWSIQVSQEARLGNIVTRTVTATGTLVNDGEITASYTVRLAAPSATIDAVSATLAPGTSQSISLSGSVAVESGDAFSPRVFLDRNSPQAANNIDSFTGSTWFENHAHAAGGSLSGFGTSVSNKHRPLRAR